MAAGAAAAGPAAAAAGRDYGATLWTPDPATVEHARISQLRALAGRRARRAAGPAGYDELWRWSVTEPGAVLGLALGLLRRARPARRRARAGRRPDARRDLVRRDHPQLRAQRAARARTDPDRTAVIYRSEAGRAGRLSYGRAGAGGGPGPGRAARRSASAAATGWRPTCPTAPEALIGLLATASLGAIWTSCSPDFGATSVIDRFAQTAPKVLIAVDGYVYGGKRFDRRAAGGRHRGGAARPAGAGHGGLPGRGPGRPGQRAAGTPAELGRPETGPDPAGPGPARRSSTRCRSTIRCGCCTPRGPPACPSRSCTATAGSCWSTSRRCACTRTWALTRRPASPTCSSGTPRPAG